MRGSVEVFVMQKVNISHALCHHCSNDPNQFLPLILMKAFDKVNYLRPLNESTLDGKRADSMLELHPRTRTKLHPSTNVEKNW